MARMMIAATTTATMSQVGLKSRPVRLEQCPLVFGSESIGLTLGRSSLAAYPSRDEIE
jgi:hypothetical protein